MLSNFNNLINNIQSNNHNHNNNPNKKRKREPIPTPQECKLNIDGVCTPKIGHICNIIPLPNGWVEGSTQVVNYYNTMQQELQHYLINDVSRLVNEYTGKGYICIYDGYDLYYQNRMCIIRQIYNAPLRPILFQLSVLVEHNEKSWRTSYIALKNNDVQQIIINNHNNIYDPITLCKQHECVMPCDIYECRDATISNNRVYCQVQAYKEKQRQDLINRFNVDEPNLRLLIDDLCLEDANDRYNYTIIKYALEGRFITTRLDRQYSGYDDNDNDPSESLFEMLSKAGYKHLIEKMDRYLYTHYKVPQLILIQQDNNNNNTNNHDNNNVTQQQPCVKKQKLE